LKQEKRAMSKLAIAAIPLLAGALMIILPEALMADVSATKVALGVGSDITVVIPSLATPATPITIITPDAIISSAP
jgi:hypothetical protein